MFVRLGIIEHSSLASSPTGSNDMRCVMTALLYWLLLFSQRDAFSEVDYVSQVKPLLVGHCVACHGPVRQKGGLRLDTAAAIKSGGESGAALSLSEPSTSLLLEVLTGKAGYSMPPEGEGVRLSEAEVAIIAEWIKEGAHAPTDEEPLTDPGDYWSYQPVVRPQLSSDPEDTWSRNAIDRLVHRKHRELKLQPVTDAPPDLLLRRLFLDLIGLPPTRAELHAFVAAPSNDAYAKIVDDLLSRPQYGERWGRHWMDVWRYSDWYGSRAINEMRYSQRHIWKWRNWIIESLNEDTGYDQMVREMLAADEIAPTDINTLRATGFLGRNWYKFDRNVWLFETVEQTSQAFLGLTLRCCRCHDHKYDPISQLDYYRFRAFFEPHDVRTDPLSAGSGVIKDQTLGEIPVDGLSRIYDKTIDAPTWLFERGNDRSPDKSQPIHPAVPASLEVELGKIAPVSLPAAAWYPALQSDYSKSLVDAARTEITKAQTQLEKTKSAAEVAAMKLATAEAATPVNSDSQASEGRTFLRDDFSSARPDVWKTLNGDWKYEDGHLTQKSVTSFATIVTAKNHPRDFSAKVRYRPLSPGAYRSVGFSFDFVDKGNSQDVYTSTGDARQSIQAFHRTGGKQVYPRAGIVPVKLKVGEETLVEVTVRGTLLKISLNGELKLEYVMPEARRDGQFALWVHSGAAEFLELDIQELRESVDDLRRKQLEAVHAVALQEKQIQLRSRQLDSLNARIAAERAKHSQPPSADAADLAEAASAAERRVAVTQTEMELQKTEQQLELLKQSQPSKEEADTTEPPAFSGAEKLIAEARKKLTAATEAAACVDTKYEPLGPTYPKTSSGRRLALANWITDPRNPRTARIAANHIWLRHFGEALVPSVENFGLNGKQPSHPELLDWLASELVEHDWSMKHLHRQIVLSRTYRLSSAAVDDSPNRNVDRENIFLWRANSRRMEAEVVRDCVLATAGKLNLERGGPEIPQTEGATSLRRSLYFRITPDDRMKFLELFDVANPNACYRRSDSVVPQQALAMTNSALPLEMARHLARQIDQETADKNVEVAQRRFVEAAFEQVISRQATSQELDFCVNFLNHQTELLTSPKLTAFEGPAVAKVAPSSNKELRAKENLIHVLYCHNDFVTIR
jgi:mono/diheme cytochrome c family protein